MASREESVETGEKIRVKVNGRWMELPGKCTLPALLDLLGFDRRYLVVEHNGEPQGRESFDTLVLMEGDQLELVRPVAGG